MSVQALQQYTFASRYARLDEVRQTRETWDEAVARIENMHLRRYPEVRAEIASAFDLVRRKRVLAAGRALQFAGEPVERRHALLYNCSGSFCDRLRFFQEAFWLSLCGCGVGFSVQKHHVARLPRLRPEALHAPAYRTHIVEDSPEGWADALGVLLSCFFEQPILPEYAGFTVRFNYDRIRPAGSPLPDGLGPAPGPDQLRASLEMARAHLTACLARGQTRLRPIDAYDLLLHISGAVQTGGVRRCAYLCIFSPDDEEMLQAKTGNWFHEQPQRSRSNNSCLLSRDSTTREQFEHILESVREFGEPGFVWSDSTEYLTNPCGEIGFWPVDESTGLAGWGMSTLTEINGGCIRTRGEFAQAARAAAWIGTWQTGYTDLPYLGAASERIVRRDALLGVSITGMMENPGLLLDPTVQREMARLVVEANAEMAARIGVGPAARTTCIKPAGSSSCLLGTSSGIHPHHARRYFRRVRAPGDATATREFEARHPHAVQSSILATVPGEVVLTFCVEAPPSAQVRGDMAALDFLELVRQTQQNWVLPGTRQKSADRPPPTHNVSNTVTVEQNEWAEVGRFLYDHRADFTGVTLLPATADRDYPQAPFCAVPTSWEIRARHGISARRGAGLVAAGLAGFDGQIWSACDALLHQECSGEERGNAWLLEARRFARRYFDGDLRRLSHYLQDVHHEQLWNDLTRAAGGSEGGEGETRMGGANHVYRQNNSDHRMQQRARPAHGGVAGATGARRPRRHARHPGPQRRSRRASECLVAHPGVGPDRD